MQLPTGDKESADVKLAGTGSVFHVHNVSRIYRMGEVEVHALREVTVDLYQGEFAVLLGASGSGKSTLLNILGGLDRPTSGEVYYRDHNLTTADDDGLTLFRREHVGFVFQFYNLIPSLTALENVALVTEIAERPIDPAEALDLVGLGNRANHFPSQLSGGSLPLKARVKRVEPYAFTKVSALGIEEKRTNVVADFVDAPQPLRVNAHIVVWARDDVIKVPSSALFRCAEAWCAFAVENGSAKKRIVKIGHSNAQEAEVLEGLKPGETVIRHPANQIEEGARVKTE